MLRAFTAVRPDERRDAWSAFVMLFCFIGSHTVLETARDALFLSKIPARQLPWVYLAIAGVSLVVAQVQARIGTRVDGRRALGLWTTLAALCTFGFWVGLPLLGAVGLYALYVWSGVLTALVLVHFWTVLGDLFSVTQAKRLYGMIGAGSVLGAIAGSGLATVMARWVEPRQLVLASALGFVVAAASSRLFRDTARPVPLEADEVKAEPRRGGLAASAGFVSRQPYARRVATLLFAAAATLTIADFVFKRAVADAVPASELGATFATIYLALNVASLVAQLLLTGWVIRRLGLPLALAVLPVLLLVGGAGLAAFAGLPAALLIKGADGSLRYTLHRTSTELLFVPLSEVARRRVKAFIDVVGQRGGQSLASIGILAAVALAAPSWAMAVGLCVLSAAWLWSALGLRAHYLELFRGQLREGALEHLDAFPDLDVASLETLVGALDSEVDGEVLAALEALEREGKARLVPALILYHPSDDVVQRALRLFVKLRRTNVLHIVDRLLEHGSVRVRAAAVAARSLLEHDERKLMMRLSFEESPEVRAAIVVTLITNGDISGAEADERIEDLLQHGSAQTRVALAQAISRRGASTHVDVLTRLAGAVEPDVRNAAAHALGHLGHPDGLPTLIDLLGSEPTRRTAARALVRYGAVGVDAMAAALADPSLPGVIRWNIPKVLAGGDASAALSVLVSQLVVEADGMLRYRLIRAIEQITRREPTARFDKAPLERVIDQTISRAYRYLDRRVVLARGVDEDAARRTPGHALLADLLADKQKNAMGRLFRLLGVVQPGEDFGRIQRGLASVSKEHRASSLELLEHALSGARRAAVLGLCDDIPDAERLASAGPFHTPLSVTYEALLAQMLDSESDAVTEITAYHAGELGLRSLRPNLEALEPSPDVLLALSRLGAARPRSQAPEVALAH